MFEGQRGRDLLVRGLAAAKANSHQEARFFFERLLQVDPPVEYRIQAWRYLGEVADAPDEKRRYLEKILAVDPTDGLARRDLSILDGRLNPSSLVDPERIVQRSPEPAGEGAARALACRHCGSHRVVFAPDGRHLVCEHCRHQEALDAAGLTTIRDHDFASAMWTARGRSAPVSAKLFKCQSCGARFLPATGALSLTCPYCISVHVVDQPDTCDLILPDALIPCRVTRNQAIDAIQEWRQRVNTREPLVGPSGLYTPVWMFRFTGEMQWTGVTQESEEFELAQSGRVSGSRAVLDLHSLVCATNRIPETLHQCLDEFDLTGLVPYDTRYLADWPAETYGITLENASLIARRIALAKFRTKAQADIEGIRELEMNFNRVGIDSFQLLMLPFWIGRVGQPGGHLVLVNGQTGRCSANLPRPRFQQWIDALLGRTN
jgi:tetratricopeptide (TPR) repeat protein